APKTVHHRVHELDLRMPIEFGSEQFIQFAKRSLIRRVIVTRHAVILLVAHLRGIALPLAFELYGWNLIKQKIWHPWLRHVGILQLNAEPDRLVVTPSQLERNFPPLREVEPTRLLLHLAPVWAQVDLLHERQF